MDWLKDTLIGIAIMAICWLLYALYIEFNKICNENSKRGRIARIANKLCNGTILTYIAICTILGLVIGLIEMFTS